MANILWSKATELLNTEGYTGFGFAPLQKPLSIDVYRSWIEAGYAGEMTYLKTHMAQKESPRELMPKARSAIVVQADYVPHPKPFADFPLKTARVALYARGEDYHFWLKEKLAQTVLCLKQEFPEHEFVVFSDSSPVLERDLAYRAGLGWIGKNTCLIDPKKGSLFLIGEIYTTLDFNLGSETDPSDKKFSKFVPDHCGTCTRCIDACPTQALIEPRKLDANRCISYLTIESKATPPEELRTKIGDWLFGCDICQAVCPWNIKFKGAALNVTLNSSPQQIAEDATQERTALVEELKFILLTSNKKLAKIFAHSPLNRAAGNKLKRNAMIVAANRQLTELVDSMHSFVSHPQLGEIALWALDKLNQAV